MASSARTYGLVDEAFALVQGAHLAASEDLETEARKLSADVLAQVSPLITAPDLQDRADDLGRRIEMITHRNPLDELYNGPVFPQDQNNYLSGRIAATVNDGAGKVGDVLQKLGAPLKALTDEAKKIVWGVVIAAVLLAAFWIFVNRRRAA
jgi:hypothetical protein